MDTKPKYQNVTAKNKIVITKWDLFIYDVWGNVESGWDVNDTFCFSHSYPIGLDVQINNPGTPRMFLSAYPEDSDIRRAYGLTNIQLSLSGDDTHIYIERESDGFPIGHMDLVNGDSLSPIRLFEDDLKEY